DPVLRRPMTFLIRNEIRAVIIDTHAIYRAEASGDDVGVQSVPAHLEHRTVLRNDSGQTVPPALGVIKIPVQVRLQAGGKLVKMFSDLMVVVEILDKINLAIAIAIMRPGNLVATTD